MSRVPQQEIVSAMTDSGRILICSCDGTVPLGTEAIRRLEVEGFPAIVLYDCHGGDLYQDGQKVYAREDG